MIQDVLTLHGSQFRNADCIVASPPCQRYSWMAMPWSLAKREASWQRWQRDSAFSTGFDLNDLFDACFRIQREASEAAGRKIPLVVENVKGAQPWVGKAKAHFGSYYLWGDVESVGGRIVCGLRPRFGETISTKKWAKRIGSDARQISRLARGQVRCRHRGTTVGSQTWRNEFYRGNDFKHRKLRG